MPDFSFESFLITLAFVLPGFLTSRLLISQIPALENQPKPFVEITESLLRSTYINLIVGTPTILILRYFILSQNELTTIINNGFQEFLSSNPFESTIVLIIWLTLDFVLAAFLGFKWDPLYSLYARLRNIAGVNNNDSWANLKQVFADELNIKPNNLKIWAQARLKNGSIYQGGVKFVSFREDGNSRELLLTDVNLYKDNREEKYHAVVIDTDNCDSIDILVEGHER